MESALCSVLLFFYIKLTTRYNIVDIASTVLMILNKNISKKHLTSRIFQRAQDHLPATIGSVCTT